MPPARLTQHHQARARVAIMMHFKLFSNYNLFSQNVCTLTSQTWYEAVARALMCVGPKPHRPCLHRDSDYISKFVTLECGQWRTHKATYQNGNSGGKRQ